MTATVVHAKIINPPKILIEDAIVKSKEYLNKKNIKLSNCFIQKVSYENILDEYKPSYWSIIWRTKKNTEYSCRVIELRVFNDGSVIQVLGY